MEEHNRGRKGFGKVKETIPYFTLVKVKGGDSGDGGDGGRSDKEEREEEEEGDVSEASPRVYTFIAMTTLPDRSRARLADGRVIEGEILAKKVLDKIAVKINDKSRSGDGKGSYRMVSLFHDRVHTGDYKLEEAGYIVPGSAKVLELPSHPGNYGLYVDNEVNEKYVPSNEHSDYTPEKIHYKIKKDAIGLSVEYTNRPDQESIVNIDAGLYRYIMDSDDFQGFGYARTSIIGNTTAVRVKEQSLSIKVKGEQAMEQEEKEKLEKELAEEKAKSVELQAKADAAEKEGAEAKAKELNDELSDIKAKVKEMELKADESAVKIKESIERAFENLDFKVPGKTEEDVPRAKVKEVYSHTSGDVDFVKFKEAADMYVSENGSKIKEMLSRSGCGFDFEKWQTVEVKCQGSQMVVVPTAKTKDVIDAGDMAESTYNQTNAMFADRYVSGITETFLRSNNLLTAVRKEQHIGGNDHYQWKIWTDFVSVSGDNTLAVDPNITSVARTQRKFEKMQTPIREYREGVEVTDFVQAHSMAAIGNLLELEMERASLAVTESLSADLFKGKVENTSGWVGVNGLIGYADSSTYSTLYGKSRSAANRLLDGTLANTYESTSEAISSSVLRQGYEKVLAHGSNFADLVIAIHPTQMRKIFDTEDADIRHQIVVNAPAPAAFGFDRAVIPLFEGIPMIRDYHCESSANAADMFAVIDMSADKGLNLVVSKPLGARGLAKVGTSEAAYVNFWGCTAYKSPRNVFVHDSLT